VSRYITNALALRPEPGAGPANEPLPKLASPVTERVVGAAPEIVAPLLSVSDEKT
jgi:hypothetical protein